MVQFNLPNHSLARFASRHLGADLCDFAGDVAAKDVGIVEGHECVVLHLGLRVSAELRCLGNTFHRPSIRMG